MTSLLQVTSLLGLVLSICYQAVTYKMFLPWSGLWTGCGRMENSRFSGVEHLHVCVYSSISPETLTRSSANESANSLKSSGDREEGGSGEVLCGLWAESSLSG